MAQAIELPYNFNGYPLQVPQELLEFPIILNVQKLSNKPFKDAVAVATRPPLTPLAKEMTEVGESSQVVLVGFTFPKAPEFGAKTTSGSRRKTAAKGGGDRKAIGKGNQPVLDETEIFPVGVAYRDNCKAAVCLALANADDTHLCETFTVDQELVFFLPQFRDDQLVDKDKRRAEWLKRIRDWVNQQFKQNLDDTVRFSSKYAATPITIPPNLSAMNYIKGLVATHKAFPMESWPLQAIQQALEEIEPLLKYPGLSRSKNLQHLFEPRRAPPSETDAQEAVNEAMVLWPEIQDLAIIGDEASQLACAVREGGKTIPFPHWRTVLVCWVQAIREHGTTNLDTCTDMANLIIGDKAVEPDQADETPLLAVIQSVLDHLRAVLGYSNKYMESLRNLQGDTLTAASMKAVDAKFREAVDVDSATLWMHHLRRFDLAQLGTKELGMHAHVEKLIKWLEQVVDTAKKARN